GVWHLAGERDPPALGAHRRLGQVPRAGVVRELEPHAAGHVGVGAGPPSFELAAKPLAQLRAPLGGQQHPDGSPDRQRGHPQEAHAAHDAEDDPHGEQHQPHEESHENSASTKSSGSKSTRSSGASPRPTSLMGMPSSPWMASTMPPLAVPSSFVSTTPVTSTASANSRACTSPFWPVVASITSSVSVTRPGSRSATRRTFFSSSIRFTLVWRRPAVSASTRSAPRAAARWTASNTTEPGSPPSAPRTRSAPTRRAQSS